MKQTLYIDTSFIGGYYDIEFEEFTKPTDLAIKYISEKVVGMTSFADCLHIALATIYKADILVS